MSGGPNANSDAKKNHSSQSDTRVPRSECSEGYVIENMELRIPDVLQFNSSLVIVHLALLRSTVFPFIQGNPFYRKGKLPKIRVARRD